MGGSRCEKPVPLWNRGCVEAIIVRMRAKCCLAILTVIAAYWAPVLLSPQTRVAGGALDPMLVAYFIDWVAEHLLDGELWDPPFFYPEKNVLTYSDHMLGMGALWAPFRGFVHSPALMINLLTFAGFVLTAWAVFFWLCDLAREDEGRFASESGWTFAALAASLTFVLSAWRLNQLTHPQLLFMPFLPLSLLLMRRGLRLNRTWQLWAASAALALQTLFTPSLSVFLTPLAGGYLVLQLMLLKPRPRPRSAANALVSLTLAPIVNLPFALRYWREQEEGFARTLEEVRTYSARWIDWISAASDHWLHSTWLPASEGTERTLFPGASLALVAALGLASLAMRRSLLPWMPFLATGAVALWASFGPSPNFGWSLLHWPYDTLYSLLPGGRSIRAPARFVLLAALFLSPLLLAGWQRIWSYCRKLARGESRTRIAAAVLTAAALAEGVPGPIFFEESDPQRHEMEAQRLRSAQAAIILPLPPLSRFWAEIDRMWTARRAQVPIFNGYSGRAPSLYLAMLDAQHRGLSSLDRLTFLSLLSDLGFDAIVMDAPTHPLIDENFLKPRVDGGYTIPDLPPPPRRIIRPQPGRTSMYFYKGWSAAETDGRHSWIWSIAPNPKLRVPIASSGASRLALRVRSLPGSRAGSFEVLLDGRSLGSRPLLEAPSEAVFELPAGAFEVGWHVLELRGPVPRMPAPASNPPDRRRLGICLFEIQFR